MSHSLGLGQSALPALRGFREVQEGGYHPCGVFDSVRDADKFEFWFAKLPEDLTGADLEPLYLLAADDKQQDQLRRREKSWTPNPDNLGTKYNGPVGKDREPTPYNLKKWREAVEAKRVAHLNRFEADLATMKLGDVPPSLRLAAELLVRLAKEADGDQTDTNEWDGCTGGTDMPAIAAALRLVERAGVEVKASAQSLAKAVEESLWEDLEMVETVTKQMEVQR